ncbi:hypothetical protein [Nitrosomonas sp. Nm84]|uniref:hypothetical protein n=1 Tax=Nitrosomonas sp. Nm84 TaxID=200124 RepID=UPI000D768950|nr:hypothetical protein [Nitrosomonas sp. Nm84]
MKWMPLFLFLIFLTSSVPANDLTQPDAATPTRFVVMGDMPYTDSEYALLEQPDGAIAKAIKALNPPVLIHLGDFKRGRLSCDDERYKDHYRQIANLNPHRTVYTPGDNDWTDCDRFTFFTRHDELERLTYLRQLFFHQDSYQLTKDIAGLVRQEGYIENARWQMGSVVLATLHIPGTNNGRKEILRSDTRDALNEADYRDQSNAEWLNQLFTVAKSAQAAVIAFHADIFDFDYTKPVCTLENRMECDGYRMIRDLIKSKATQFNKPVLVIHGDSTAYCLHQPYPEIPNLWRLNVPGDYIHTDVNQILVNPKNRDMPFAVTGVLNPKPAPAVCSYSFLGNPFILLF